MTCLAVVVCAVCFDVFVKEVGCKGSERGACIACQMQQVYLVE